MNERVSNIKYKFTLEPALVKLTELSPVTRDRDKKQYALIVQSIKIEAMRSFEQDLFPLSLQRTDCEKMFFLTCTVSGPLLINIVSLHMPYHAFITTNYFKIVFYSAKKVSDIHETRIHTVLES